MAENMHHQRAAATFAYRTGTTFTFAREYLSHRFSTIEHAYEAFNQEKHKLWMLSWQSHITKRIALADGALKLPAGMKVWTLEPLFELVMFRTGVVAEHAHTLLARTDWDVHRAEALFHQIKDSLPPQAWQLVYKLSSRTGMAANYSRKYLVESEFDYSDALQRFARDYDQLPAEALAKLPHTTTWLDLPAELRNRIYGFVFDDVQRDADGHVGFRRRVPGIVQVNAYVRKETLKFYLSSVSFSACIKQEREPRRFHTRKYFHWQILLDWLDMLGPANVTGIRSLTIFLSGSVTGGFDLYPSRRVEEQGNDGQDEEGDKKRVHGDECEVCETWGGLRNGLQLRGVRQDQLPSTSVLSAPLWWGCLLADESLVEAEDTN